MDRLHQFLTGRARDVELDRAALWLARVEYPRLEIEPFLAILDGFASELATRLGPSDNPEDYLVKTNGYLLDELGFQGNTDNYYDARNSCLNDVLTLRKGIPITLSLVYMEVSRRLRRPLRGIGLPGHFLVEYREGSFSAYVDIFNGGRLLDEKECFALARHATGSDIPEDPMLLAPVDKRQILIRMLNNLRRVYLQQRTWGKALRVLNLLLAARPASAEHRRERGIIYLEMRNIDAAKADLEAYLELAPDASDYEKISTHVRKLKQYLAGMN